LVKDVAPRLYEEYLEKKKKAEEVENKNRKTEK